MNPVEGSKDLSSNELYIIDWAIGFASVIGRAASGLQDRFLTAALADPVAFLWTLGKCLVGGSLLATLLACGGADAASDASGSHSGSAMGARAPQLSAAELRSAAVRRMRVHTAR